MTPREFPGAHRVFGKAHYPFPRLRSPSWHGRLAPEDTIGLNMPDNSNIRVLIADDHKMVRDGLHALLARQPGIDVVGEADGGASAVAMARNLRPDVVIMDVAMPGMSGIDATREITHDLIGVKVIALSMHNNASFVSKMIDAGAVGYILKDCAFEELTTAIHTVLDKKTYVCRALASPSPRQPFRYLPRQGGFTP